MGIAQHLKKEDKLGEAVRYQNPKGERWFSKSSGKKIYITPKALDYLSNLNGYDQHQVTNGIQALSGVSCPHDGMVNKHRPTFLKAKMRRQPYLILL